MFFCFCPDIASLETAFSGPSYFFATLNIMIAQMMITAPKMRQMPMYWLDAPNLADDHATSPAAINPQRSEGVAPPAADITLSQLMS